MILNNNIVGGDKVINLFQDQLTYETTVETVGVNFTFISLRQ